MTVEQVIALLLKTMNSRQKSFMGAFNASAGSVGNIMMVQRDLNAAIGLWQTKQDASGLIQVTATLHMYGNLTDTEYEQVMETLQNGEK